MSLVSGVRVSEGSEGQGESWVNLDLRIVTDTFTSSVDEVLDTSWFNFISNHISWYSYIEFTYNTNITNLDKWIEKVLVTRDWESFRLSIHDDEWIKNLYITKYWIKDKKGLLHADTSWDLVLLQRYFRDPFMVNKVK